MKILIISLSDIHFTKDENKILYRIDKIFDAIKNLETNLKKIILLISGDITYSGKSDEYFLAYYFLENITEKLKAYCNCDVEVIPSPGNHDCDFRDDEKNLRRISIEDIYKNEDLNLDSHLIEFLSSPLTDFFEFRNNLNSFKNLKYDHKLIYQYNFQLDPDFSIKINCYNTAWLSQVKEQQGKLYFPISYLPQESEFNVSNLTLSLLHHPYNWYTESNARQFRDYLEKNRI